MGSALFPPIALKLYEPGLMSFRILIAKRAGGDVGEEHFSWASPPVWR
jgi:hypothetical protein